MNWFFAASLSITVAIICGLAVQAHRAPGATVTPRGRNPFARTRKPVFQTTTSVTYLA